MDIRQLIRSEIILKAIFLLYLVVFFQLNLSEAQDLDPRAYIRAPIKTTTFVSAFSYSYGGVVSDPTLPVENIKANVYTASMGVSRSFSLFGLSSSAFIALPYSWASVTGDVGNQQQQISREGLADMRMRLTVLLLGGKAASLQELVKQPRKTIIGVSLNAVAPTGEFHKDKLVNLGTNRWAFRPELALSQPLSKRWLLDLYSGVWLFADNPTFYPGNAVRSQAAMGAFQMHLSYNINPLFWVALDGTYYTGGQSSINQLAKDDRQSNTRIGITAVLPTGKLSTIRFAASTGAVVRIGQDFTSFSLGWQKSWLGN